MVQHVLVLTDDLEASRAFYVDVLGFVVADTPPLEFSGIWLRLEEDADASIHLADRREYLAHVATLGMGPVAGALDHVAIRRDGYDALTARLEAAGVEATRNEVPGLFRQLFVVDPNGVRLELNVPVATLDQ
jgi:catechol 2,3-dioxygenase-like lactoylglutathione lyase family enzyme